MFSLASEILYLCHLYITVFISVTDTYFSAFSLDSPFFKKIYWIPQDWLRFWSISFHYILSYWYVELFILY